jgi:hypothetical protein
MERDEIERLWKELNNREPVVIPEGQAAVLLVAHDTAEIVTALHPVDAPLQVPAQRIAEQARLPVTETAGRLFAVATLTRDDADGFTLLNDPRL